MISKFSLRSPLHEHSDPAQRLLAVAELAPDSVEIVQLLTADPTPEVRAAAAQRCKNLASLVAAWSTEQHPEVRSAIAAGVANVLAEAEDNEGAQSFLLAESCTDAIRADVARRAHASERRRAAIAAIGDEAVLVDVALNAGQAETRLAAAERVHSPEALEKLAEAAKDKDRGVMRLARSRIDAIKDKEALGREADIIIEQLEDVATRSGPVLTAVVEINRRWQTLDMSADPARLARFEAARQKLQARFDHEQEEQRARVRFERRVHDFMAAFHAPLAAESVDGLKAELNGLRDEAQARNDATALAKLHEATGRLAAHERKREALASAEALVVEAERLAAAESGDDAKLLDEWQSLDMSTRTPELTRRFEAALIAIEQRRLAQIRAAQQEANAVRLQIHGMLHGAEQALVAGQLHAARSAVDQIKALKGGTGALPKPTVQRLSRLTQQLVELERWETFGQRNARIQLCERAEALATQTLDAPALAHEVQQLRNEWKKLDEQHAGVPHSLWERFDAACEKAYAPAAKHFAEAAARRKEARRQRDEFIAQAAAHAQALATEPRDWRAIERWMREADHTWHEGSLGSLEPRTWKKLDGEFKAALAPLRDALSARRNEAKDQRKALIDEVGALAPKALERETPSQVKAIQTRWQERAKSFPLPQRDERGLWEQFRAACDAIFKAREATRKEEDDRKQEGRRALEALCAQAEQLAHAADQSEADIRRALNELQDQWKKHPAASDPALRNLESRFRNARTQVEAALGERTRARETAVWQTLAAKERLCEELDAGVTAVASGESANASTAVSEQWAALPALPAAWEAKLASRRDAALAALADPAAAAQYADRIAKENETRNARLLELELMLGLDSPAELQPQRLALQMVKLRERFKGEVVNTSESASAQLLAWCTEPGTPQARDRQRFERIVAKMERAATRTSAKPPQAASTSSSHNRRIRP